MQLVESYSDIHRAHSFAKSFRKKSITNFFLQEEDCLTLIRDKVLFQYQTGEVVFLIRKNSVHSNIYFYASSFESLNVSLPDLLSHAPAGNLVIDIVAREEKPELLEVLQNHGFALYTSLVRMSAPRESMKVSEEGKQASTKEAEISLIPDIHKLLHTYFNPLSEQLPTIEKLEAWAAAKSLLVCEINGQTAGFIIYEINGQTQYLRYWFVHPEFRNRKVGSALFRHFLAKGKDSVRKIFWVVRSNDNAIKRYKHYGFLEENMFNFVMINRQEHERENN